MDEKLHCKCKSVCKAEAPTCHVARQEGHGWALELNGTPNRRPRFYAVKLYSGLFKCILHRIAPFKCFIHPPLVALFTLAMISKLFGGYWIAVMVKHLIHTRQITQFKSLWTKNETIWLLHFSQVQCSWWNNMVQCTKSFWLTIFVSKNTTNVFKACFQNSSILGSEINFTPLQDCSTVSHEQRPRQAIVHGWDQN